MVFLIGLLTFVMVLDCVILILLVLIQLPKKEAGAGLAFGGAATDAAVEDRRNQQAHDDWYGSRRFRSRRDRE